MGWEMTIAALYAGMRAQSEAQAGAGQMMQGLQQLQGFIPGQRIPLESWQMLQNMAATPRRLLPLPALKCGYCGRRTRTAVENCEGCGAPV